MTSCSSIASSASQCGARARSILLSEMLRDIIARIGAKPLVLQGYDSQWIWRSGLQLEGILPRAVWVLCREATEETTMSDDALVLRQDREGIATLTLNRPQARNALSVAMMSALQEALDAVAHDDVVRVIVI